MKISDYTYKLPENLIATEPPAMRGDSRLMVLDKASGSIMHRDYYNLDEYVSAGDVVVLNDTKVIKARLIAKNSKDQPRELLLLEEHGDHQTHKRQVIYRGSLKSGEILKVGDTTVLVDEIQDGGLALISSTVNLLELSDSVGNVPLPPYMHREAKASDIERYQTVFAREPGSVAAPTASLNFTHELEAKILAKGAKIVYLTLHVGLGTFLPIRTDNVEDHEMHSEYFEIPAETAEDIRGAKKSGRKILAVGTTVARTLEFAAEKILEGPEALSGEANIFIYPGYEFRLVDALLTNFHAPKSTVLMLATSFADWENLKKAYEEAIKEKYAFLSYGDSMLIINGQGERT